MIKSSYQEGLYYWGTFQIETAEVEQQILTLLCENHGVGIIGGYYEKDFPFCMVSDLTMQMLGYTSAEEFERATGGCLAGLVKKEDYAGIDFTKTSDVYGLHLRGRQENLWVRLMKREVVLSSGQRIWLASVCNMDALYQKELQVNRMIEDRYLQELAHQEKLKQANLELEKQKIALEHALAEARLNNEVISTIGKIYWLIYRLDLEQGTFEEISVKDERSHLTGDCGKIAERFPKACRLTVQSEYRENMLAFLDMNTLSERMRDREEIAQEYRTITGNWHVGRFIVQKRDADGNVTKALYTIQIINEQKQQELEYEKKLAGIAEEAQRASLSKTDFLRRMSHDIRTPINGIRGMIEIANHFADDLQKQKECRDKVWEASGYLLSLVNSVLDMNKLESGAVVLTETPFDLPQLLSEVNTVAEMQAAEHGLYYGVDMEKQQIAHPYLIGSAPHLKQVLMNLASNAVKYNKENGRVIVWCSELSCDEKIAVFQFACTDTGIGMSREFQKRAFEPFTQEGRDNARTHYDGTGLGLSIVRALVQQMGGNITFESEEGVGTSFLVTLPFCIDTNPQTKPKETVNEPIDLSGVRVLLAEDNDLNMEIAKFFIEQHGAEVTVARNGKEAVELFARAPQGTFDLILMDVMMPVMSGYEATETIRGMAREDAKTIPIIAMSANAFQDDIQKSRSVGMNDHLPKPLSTEKLLSAIARHITPVR